LDILIDREGRHVPAEDCDVALLVKIGLAHISIAANSATISLQPDLVSRATLAAICYLVADLRPECCVVLAASAAPRRWVCSGHWEALARIAALAEQTAPHFGHAAADISADLRANTLH
jgi:hypothetical protein